MWPYVLTNLCIGYMYNIMDSADPGIANLTFFLTCTNHVFRLQFLTNNNNTNILFKFEVDSYWSQQIGLKRCNGSTANTVIVKY